MSDYYYLTTHNPLLDAAEASVLMLKTLEMSLSFRLLSDSSYYTEAYSLLELMLLFAAAMMLLRPLVTFRVEEPLRRNDYPSVLVRFVFIFLSYSKFKGTIFFLKTRNF